MKVFVRVAQGAGFAAAARDLRISNATASKHVSALERQIGTRLFDRTTRRVALTEAGRIYLERCLEALHALEDADASVGELTRDPRGLLRITAPFDFGEHVVSVVNRVMNAHPDLAVDLRLSNRVVDMVEEGVDVGIRIAQSLDGSYVARPLARSRLVVFGSPDYFAIHGRPQRPEDLPGHRSVVFAEPKLLDNLVFVRGRRRVAIKLNTALSSNSGGALWTAARAGLGLCVCPSFMAGDDLANGRMEPVLLDWALPEYNVYAVYPHRRFLSPKVKVFLEALTASIGDGTRDPWWPDRLSDSGAAPSKRSRSPRRMAPRAAERKRRADG
jgi:DNA-binding transcriptional LysR family regulator